MPTPVTMAWNLARTLACGTVALTCCAVGAPALQRHQPDQRAAMEGRQSGRILALRDIEKRVVPTMRGAQYLGFDFDPPSAIYTLKFLRDGAVLWIDVDGRTGKVVGRSGN